MLGVAIVSLLVAIELLGSRAWPIALLVAWAAVCFQFPLLILARRRAKQLKGEATTDERLKMIRRNASDWSGTIFIVICWCACMIAFFVYRRQGKEIIAIRVDWLGWFVIVSASLLSLLTTIIIRILRGREPKDGQN